MNWAQRQGIFDFWSEKIFMFDIQYKHVGKLDNENAMSTLTKHSIGTKKNSWNLAGNSFNVLRETELIISWMEF